MRPCFVSPSKTEFQVKTGCCFAKLLRYYRKLPENRYIQAYLVGNRMVLKYKTKAGYFIKASVNAKCICYRKEYFRKYDKQTGRFSDYLFTRRMPLMAG